MGMDLQELMSIVFQEWFDFVQMRHIEDWGQLCGNILHALAEHFRTGRQTAGLGHSVHQHR